MRNRFKTLQKLDVVDTMSELITDMIQQSASRVAKAINKPQKSRISSPTRALNNETRRNGVKRYDKQRLKYEDRTSGNATKRSHEKHHGIKELEESPKNAETALRYMK